jgi:phosphoglycerol transferase MdoB-like AlkP superfamily enzyme
MKKLIDFLPQTVLSLVLRLAIVLVVMSATRFIFFVYNSDSFQSIHLLDWLIGCWFDVITVSLLFFPFILFSLIPNRWQQNNWIALLHLLTYLLPFATIVALNLMDTAYFDFTQKRSTADLFAIVSAGNDVSQLLTSFIADYWLLILFFILLCVLIVYAFKKTKSTAKSTHLFTRKEVVFVLVLLPLFVLMGRGGFGLRPVSPIDSTLYTNTENSAFVLNSAFTLLKSIGKDDLVEQHYFPKSIVKKLFNPIRKANPQHILPDNTNVMIIILESFGNEWVGKFNRSTSYTPFLDSLLDKSWYFEYGFSNGKKSIEAVPTISASMPTLMDNPYISSAYSNNKLQSLPNLLKQNGYSSAFFHGATNGSMRFNSFAMQLGYGAYLGRTEYGNDSHSDKTWGILDEYFNPWTAKELSKLKEPFMANLFTLSSHHPYFVPEKWQTVVKKGPAPICKSIHYGDISLQKFFEEAKKHDWYKRTLFVLVADHTPSTNTPYYNQRTELYRIPIAFFDPSGKLTPKREKIIFQQADIMPTVLDLVNNTKDYYSIGNSYFSKNPRESIAYIEGAYYYFQHNKLLVFSANKIRGLYDFTSGKKQSQNILKNNQDEAKRMAKRLKAIIQVYNHDLIHNQTYAP